MLIRIRRRVLENMKSTIRLQKIQGQKVQRKEILDFGVVSYMSNIYELNGLIKDMKLNKDKMFEDIVEEYSN